MLQLFILIAAVALYLAAFVTILTGLQAPPNSARSNRRISNAFVIGAVGALLHGFYAYQTGYYDGALNFSLSAMSILISFTLTVFYLLGALTMPIKQLGVLVFPLTAASLLFGSLWQSPDEVVASYSISAGTHILVSICAYSLLAIASIQGLLYVYQERKLRQFKSSSMLAALPPLETMEQLLFRLIGFGFLLLTLTLLSCAFFSKEIFGQPFVFKHHTLLAILGWLVFAVLLYRHLRHGLRGSQAVIWTIGGFALIQLGYFGTKIVSESLALQ